MGPVPATRRRVRDPPSPAHGTLLKT